MHYPNHLSLRELARLAFIAGDPTTASLAEAADDLEQENQHYFDNEERLKTEAFEAGKLDGLGLKASSAIAELTAQMTQRTAQLGHAVELLGICRAWIQGVQCKTIKGRREAAHTLSGRMVSLQLGCPRH